MVVAPAPAPAAVVDPAAAVVALVLVTGAVAAQFVGLVLAQQGSQQLRFWCPWHRHPDLGSGSHLPGFQIPAKV